MVRLLMLVSLLWALVLGACDVAPEGLAPVIEEGGVELIGIDGRRLVDGARYGVPLDWGGAEGLAARAWDVGLGEVWREAFVVVNGSPEDLVVMLSLHDSDGGTVGEPGSGATGAESAPWEWRLLEPTRAREVAWSGPRPLPAGGRLDFDLGFAGRRVGEREVRLVLTIARHGAHEVRQVLVVGRCVEGRAAESADGDAGTGADPPSE